MPFLLRKVLIQGCALASLTACSEKPTEPTSAPQQNTSAQQAPTPSQLRTKAMALFGSLPEAMESPKHPWSERRIALGRMLYFDQRLSRSQSLSCNSCHDLEHGGADSRPD